MLYLKLLDKNYKATFLFWNNVRDAEFIDAIFVDLPQLLLTLPIRLMLFPIAIIESIMFYSHYIILRV